VPTRIVPDRDAFAAAAVEHNVHTLPWLQATFLKAACGQMQPAVAATGGNTACTCIASGLTSTMKHSQSPSTCCWCCCWCCCNQGRLCGTLTTYTIIHRHSSCQTQCTTLCAPELNIHFVIWLPDPMRPCSTRHLVESMPPLANIPYDQTCKSDRSGPGSPTRAECPLSNAELAALLA